MNARTIASFLSSTAALMFVGIAPAQAQHEMGEGNAFVPGTVLEVNKVPGAVVDGSIVMKKAPLLRIHAMNGQVLKRADGMIALKDWSYEPLWLKQDGQDPKRFRLTLITESPQAPDSRWQMSMRFASNATHTQDLVVKLPNRVVAQYQQMCMQQGRSKKYKSEKGGSVKGLSSTSIEPTIKYEIEHSNGVDRGVIEFKDTERFNGRTSYISQLRVAVRYECILPRTESNLSTGSKGSGVTKAKPAKPSVKRPTVNKPSPVRAR